MKRQLPFSIYDFFGYLASGFLLMIATDQAFDRGWLIGRRIDVVAGAFIITVAYILGQLIANLAGFFIERKLTRGFLGAPAHVLFGEQKPTAAFLFLFPGYYEALPELTINRILTKASPQGFSDPSDALFFHCHSIVKHDFIVAERLDAFLRLYGFCRNVCMAAAFSFVGLVAGAVFSSYKNLPAAPKLWWSAFALVVTVGMFYRYLKFYRQYAVEVFTTYAEVR